MLSELNYLKRYSFFTVLLIASVALFNWFVDPYGLYQAITIEGINKDKPEIGNHIRMQKAIAIQKLKPYAIALGTSRAEYGIDPEHPGWGNDNVFNLGIPSTNIYEVMRHFQHAKSFGNLQKVLLTVDFMQFNASRRRIDDFDEDRFAVNPDGSKNWKMSDDILSSLLSIDVLFASINTLKRQGKNYPFSFPKYLLNGQREWYHGGINESHTGGARKHFNTVEAGHMHLVWKNFRFNYVIKEGTTLDYFRNILRECYENDIDLHIVMSPSHARIWEALRVSNHWEEFEIWKKELVEINHAEGTRSLKKPFPLWDFTGYNSFTTEDVPAYSEKKKIMKWYLGASHYNVWLGNYMLDKVFNYRSSSREIVEDFGKLITIENIKQHLQDIRVSQKKYQASHREDIEEIKKIFSSPLH